ncbi:hypothetical protein ACWCPQ_28660 [Nocardia sp. NPDC001965]
MGSTIVVTGATGPVGRRVVAALAAGGAVVRAVTRHPAAAPVVGGVENISARRPFDDLLTGARAVLVDLTALGLGDGAADPGSRLGELIAAAHEQVWTTWCCSRRPRRWTPPVRSARGTGRWRIVSKPSPAR